MGDPSKSKDSSVLVAGVETIKTDPTSERVRAHLAPSRPARSFALDAARSHASPRAAPLRRPAAAAPLTPPLLQKQQPGTRGFEGGIQRRGTAARGERRAVGRPLSGGGAPAPGARDPVCAALSKFTMPTQLAQRGSQAAAAPHRAQRNNSSLDAPKSKHFHSSPPPSLPPSPTPLQWWLH